MKKATFSLLLFAIVLFACKKESTTPTKSPVEYLKAHKWAAVSLTINPASDWYETGTKITDILGANDACEKDNILGFSSDSSYFFLGGTLKCSTNETDTVETGKYSISKDLKYFARDYFKEPALIKELSDTKAVFETTFIDTRDHLQYVITETYKAK